jgi:hypothetical protein
VLKRRTIEARIVAPLLRAFAKEFGEAPVRDVARRVISDIANEQGAALAESAGGNTLLHLANTLDRWKVDDALEIDVLEESPDRFHFNVTRCRYAEMYLSLGIPELGAILSCNRDGSLIEGFNPDVELVRTQTIMGGASCCDFRYQLKRRGAGETQPGDG